MAQFQAFLIQSQNESGFTTLSTTDLDPGEVFIRVVYSSVNFKDALAGTGKGKIIRRFPCVGGIDLAGEVEESADSRFKKGDKVIATSFDIGVAHHGGYAQYARIPADWIVPLPKGLSLFDSMALGTAGFTAALGILRMEENGLSPEKGEVIVDGATGGVGSLAVDILANRGYHVVALTGKKDEEEYLKHLGAKEVLFRQDLPLDKIRPLDKARFAGAVDNLGGDVLCWIASSMKPGGTIASIGLAASHQFNTTVMPFILRGVSLLGIDSGYVGEPYRHKVWELLASDFQAPHLEEMAKKASFQQLPTIFEEYMAGKAKGRTVITIAEN